jgi:hypothetical protein
MEYRFRIVSRPGRGHINADASSRLRIDDIDTNEDADHEQEIDEAFIARPLVNPEEVPRQLRVRLKATSGPVTSEMP